MKIFARDGHVVIADTPDLYFPSGEKITLRLKALMSPGEAVRIAAALIGVAVMAWAFADPCAPSEAPPPPKPPQGKAR